MTPPEAVALLRRGNAYLDAGAYAAAVPCFAQALERAPALAEVWFGLGGALVGLGRAGEAEKACHRGLRHAPAHPVGLNSLGAALSALGRHAVAQGCFEAALGRHPTCRVGVVIRSGDRCRERTVRGRGVSGASRGAQDPRGRAGSRDRGKRGCRR